MDENVARFRSQHVQDRMVFGTLRMRSVMSQTQKVRRCLARFGPCSKVLSFTIRKGCSKRNTAVIVRFSVFVRSEAVYNMHSVPLREVLWHQGSKEKT